MEKLNNQFNSLAQQLEKIKNPLLIVHPQPDTDALGSAFTLADYLEKINQHPITIFSPTQPKNQTVKLFPLNRLSFKLSLVGYDALIFLDRTDMYFKLSIAELLKKQKNNPSLLAIDHHPHAFIPNALLVVDEQASSTSELIYRFFKHQNISFSQKQAQYLLNGIYADTGGFRHNNTKPLTLEIVAQLMRQGALITKANQILFSNKSLDTLKLWGIALDRAQVNHKTGMAVSFITKRDLKKCGANLSDLDGIAEILNTISGSRFSLILSEKSPTRIKASLRSEEYKKIDVSKIARAFKGGGHKLASGFEIDGQLQLVNGHWVVK